MQEGAPLDSTNYETLDILEALERVNGAIVKGETSEQMLANVLDEMLDIFKCERAWLLYPCSLEAEWFQVPMERTRPGFPGAGTTLEKIPIDDHATEVYSLALASDGAIAIDATSHPLDQQHRIQIEFQIKSQVVMAIRPHGDSPWLLGIHHCRSAVVYGEALALFRAIGRRVADALTTLIATDKLRQSELRFRTLVENAPEAIMIMDCETGLFTDVNPNAALLLGRSLSELKDSCGPIQISPELQPDGLSSVESMAVHLREALAGGFPKFEWDHLHSSGRIVPCEVHLALLPHPTLTLVRGSVTDNSERKRAQEERRELEERLAQSQRMEAIGHLTGGIAHDFNNLLTVIMGNLDLLELDGENPVQREAQLCTIRSAVNNASSLTHRLLAFARRQPLRPRIIDAGRLIKKMEALLGTTLGETIEIKIDIESDLWVCKVDETQLESAVLNLCINARDAMPQGGQLSIEVRNASSDAAPAGLDGIPSQSVMITVADSGGGMSPEILGHIFTPFFTTKEMGKGTGLGLSMVYGFVKQSGGHIDAHSELGQGTTIALYLPRAPEGETNVTQEVPVRGGHKGKGQWILVVEDEALVRKLTTTLLQDLGYRTHAASDADKARQLLSEHPKIELLLTDVVLGGETDGAQLVKQATAERPDLHVLFMSGYSAPALIRKGGLDRDTILLEKPFTRHQLALRVREALDSSHAK